MLITGFDRLRHAATAEIARQSAGAVHHVVLRVPDAAAIGDWAQHVNSFRVPSSSKVERYYIRSLYFRERGGNLFEIASVAAVS